MLVVTDARHDIRFMKTPGCSCDHSACTKFHVLVLCLLTLQQI